MTTKEVLDIAKGVIAIIVFIGGLFAAYAAFSVKIALIQKAVEDNTEQLKEFNKQQKEQYEINGAVLNFIENDNNHD